MKNFHRLSQLLFAKGIETKDLNYVMERFLEDKEVIDLFRNRLLDEELENLADKVYLAWELTE